MSAFLARVLLTMSLLFGSVVVPAMAGEEAGHSIEIVDVDCDVLTASADAGDTSPDDAPVLHIDHHHCSACTEMNGRGQAIDLLASGSLLFRGPATVLTSYATAPPTQPPAA
ncbi:hypothetical protein [Sphingopyxis panaciterrae]